MNAGNIWLSEGISSPFPSQRPQSETRRMSNNGFLKLIRGPDTEELVTSDPLAFVLLTQVALRRAARRTATMSSVWRLARRSSGITAKLA